ncbi:MAG: choice-of-anchor V domain-containing protein [Saprospiraceae bacterium]
MNKIFPLFVLLAGGILSLSNLDGAFPENTGAPGELTCGRAPCHNVPSNAGNALMSIEYSGNGLKYSADSTYQLTVKISNQQTLRNGFEILALNASNQNTGSWVLIEPDKMKIIPGIGLPSRKYVTHKAAGNLQTEWKVAWKAPSSNVGTVTFYASVNATNDNGMITGDEVYTKNLAVAFSPLSVTTEPGAFSNFGIVSVTASQPSQTLQIRYFLNLVEEVRLEVFNVLGQKMSTVLAGKESEGEHQMIWNGLTDNGLSVPSGVYVVRLMAGRKTSARKFFWP